MPVMFLTTEHNEGDRARAFELGADDYMTKPFDPDELGRRVSALIREPPSQRRVIRLNDAPRHDAPAIAAGEPRNLSSD